MRTLHPILHLLLTIFLLLALAPAAGADCPDSSKSKNEDDGWDVSEASGAAELNEHVTAYFQDNIETYEDVIDKGLKWISEVRVSDYEVLDLNYVIPDAIYTLDAVFPVTNCTDQDANQSITLSSANESTSSTSFDKWYENTSSYSLTTSASFQGTGIEATFETSVSEGVSQGTGYEETTASSLERSADTTVPANSGVFALLYVPNYVGDSSTSGTFAIPDSAKVDVRWRHQDNTPHVCHHTYADLKSALDVNGDEVLGGTNGTIDVDLLSDSTVTNSDGSVVAVSVSFVAMDADDYAYYSGIQCDGFSSGSSSTTTLAVSTSSHATADALVVGDEIPYTADLEAKYDFPAAP
ncbi:MAG: hypothetical protein AAF772_00755 [Acidobacteriota bacterium]